jgi:ParB family transcriptional regulator, chromosome partitioning protein
MTDISLDLLDYSPFESREIVEPLETEGEIIQPIVVRQKESRFEVIAGHRRLETLRLRGAKEAPCRILNLADEEAALALFNENRDREDFSDCERGVYFERFMDRFGLSEREAALRLGVSHTTISLCLGVVEARKRVVVPTTGGTQRELYKRTMTTNKFKEVNRLPEADKTPALRAVVENRLSTEETKTLTAKVESGKTVEEATNEILLRRETVKPERFAERKRRMECPTCKGKGYLLRSESP